ncbi:MAG TPA: VanZ family protein [Blastocatellia bacterium]|nr:VanZ family protein [Blastocatellia bacterium]
MSEDAQRTMMSPDSPGFGRFLFYWLPPLVWMGAIFVFSTDLFSARNTGGMLVTVLHWLFPEMAFSRIEQIHFLVRKGAHLTAYAILALLLVRAFRAGSAVRWDWRRALYTFFIIGVYALTDEYHQSFTRLRSASPYDSLIDITGGTIALLCLWIVRRWQLNSRVRR